jgi:hypothetical protein
LTFVLDFLFCFYKNVGSNWSCPHSIFLSFFFSTLLLRVGNGDEQREESRTKDRVISHLESELRVQTGRAQQFRDILEQSLLTAASRGSLSVSLFF